MQSYRVLKPDADIPYESFSEILVQTTFKGKLSDRLWPHRLRYGSEDSPGMGTFQS